MKLHLLPATILTLILFATINLNAQQFDWPATELPGPQSGPDATFNITKIINSVWVEDEEASSQTEKIFRSQSDLPTTAPGATIEPYWFYLTMEMGFYERAGQSGGFSVNEDMNINVTAHRYKDIFTHYTESYLILTDQLMDGVIRVRNVTGQ